MAPKNSIWTELAKSAVQGFLNGLEKKSAAKHAETDETEQPTFNPSPIPPLQPEKPQYNSLDDNPLLPPHLKRLPGESEEEQYARLDAYLAARRRTSFSGSAQSSSLGHIYDTNPAGDNEAKRVCGACDGRGRYYKNGRTMRCGNCNGTGYKRHNIIGR